MRNSNVPGDLLVRAGRQLDTLRPCRAIAAVRLLSKLEYVAVCRSFQPLMLHARGDAAKALEILVLLPRSRWSCLFVRPETLLRWHQRLIAGT